METRDTGFERISMRVPPGTETSPFAGSMGAKRRPTTEARLTG